MCGLLVCFGEDEIQDPERFLNTMRHRGPDSMKSCVIFDNLHRPLLMGHVRLSIQDVSASANQPLSMQGVTLVFNGEIYNFLELRNELECLGYVFETSSDTEVVLKAYREWGTECFHRFNGEWALCLFVEETGHLIISRDRFGIKPLYYFQDEEQILFSSNIASILDVTGSSIAQEELSAFYKNGEQYWKRSTVFHGIKRFEPGHFATLDCRSIGSKLEYTEYYNLNAAVDDWNLHGLSIQDISSKYRELLIDAVSIRMRADVPLAFALSGGLDSSCILAAARIAKPDAEITAFTTCFSEKKYQSLNELKHATAVAEYLSVDLIPVYLDLSSGEKYRKKAIFHYENPTLATAINGFSLAKEVSQHGTKVLIEGQGADEIQGGYERQLLYLANEPNFFSVIRILFGFFFTMRRKKTWLLIVLCIVAHKLNMSNLLKRYFNKANFERVEKNVENGQISEVKTTLRNLLHFSDARGMAYSIEARVPFMDHRIVEFCLAVPYAHKFKNGLGKYFARLAFAGDLPREIVFREDKLGWAMPDHYPGKSLGNKRKAAIDLFCAEHISR